MKVTMCFTITEEIENGCGATPENIFARYFDERSRFYNTNNFNTNLFEIFKFQDHCNKMKMKTGVIGLNYVYKSLGLPGSELARMYGWKKSEIDFGAKVLDGKILLTFESIERIH